MEMVLSGEVSRPSPFPIPPRKILTKSQAEVHWETQSLLRWISQLDSASLVLEGRRAGGTGNSCNLLLIKSLATVYTDINLTPSPR